MKYKKKETFILEYVERTLDRWRLRSLTETETRVRSRILWVNVHLDFHSFKVRSEANRTRRWCGSRSLSFSNMSYKVSRCVFVCVSFIHLF